MGSNLDVNELHVLDQIILWQMQLMFLLSHIVLLN